MKNFGVLGVVILVLAACNSPYTYKKKGYFRIDFPEKQYRLFDQPDYPYSFEYPVYSTIIKDTSFFDEKPENPWWINIDVPQFAGRIYISYKEIGNRNKFDSLVNDAFKMAYRKHTDIATGIKDSLMLTSTESKVFISLWGETRLRPISFFLLIPPGIFFAELLYFDTAPNADSLGIVNDFLKKDLLHLINTLKWKTPAANR